MIRKNVLEGQKWNKDLSCNFC